MSPYLLAEHSARIQCPLSLAYAYATNMEHFGDWFPGVLSIQSANDLPHGTPDKAYRERARIPLRGEQEFLVLVKEARRDAFFATEGQFPPLLPRMEVAFRGIDAASCEITWRMLSRNRGLIARLTVLPLARGVVRKRAVRGLSRLKQSLEALASRSSPASAAPFRAGR